jgi:asparagine synthase (glutamine-hydrolysing)
MHAFSVGYPGRPSNDERNNAKALADYLKMPIHEIELTTSDLVDIFEDLNFMRDDPIADISGFGYYAVSKEARSKGVPVLLQGQGGDELFWGYPWVRNAVLKTEDKLGNTTFVERLYNFWKYDLPDLYPYNKREILSRFLSLARYRNYSSREDSTAIKKYTPVFYELAPDFQIALSCMKNYYTDSFIEGVGESSAFDLFTFPTPWQYTDIRITRLICDTYLLENGIAQGDRLSMSNSVELRLPLVDYKLVELVIGLRKTHQNNPDYKRFPKPWLRGAVKDILPDWVINRPKQGFAPPVWEWHTEIFKRYGQYLKDGYLIQAGVLSQKAGADLSEGPFPPDAIAPVSFKALVLEIWCRKMRTLLD